MRGSCRVTIRRRIGRGFCARACCRPRSSVMLPTKVLEETMANRARMRRRIGRAALACGGDLWMIVVESNREMLVGS